MHLALPFVEKISAYFSFNLRYSQRCKNEEAMLDLTLQCENDDMMQHSCIATTLVFVLY